jgi:hypothetical protein
MKELKNIHTCSLPTFSGLTAMHLMPHGVIMKQFTREYSLEKLFVLSNAQQRINKNLTVLQIKDHKTNAKLQFMMKPILSQLEA